MNAIPRPLLDVLGARWRVGVAAAAVAWDSRRGIAGFALGDGTLALAPAEWEGGPVVRPREGSGAELVPATAAAPPVARLPVHQGACLSVVAHPDAGFLTCGEDGRVSRVLGDGEVRVVGRLEGPAAAIAAGRGGWLAAAIGRRVHRLGSDAATLDAGGEVTSLAVHFSGARVAIGHAGGVTLWSGGNVPRVLPVPGVARDVAWSGDGKWIGCAADACLYAWRPSDAAALTASVDAPVGAFASSGSVFAAGAAGRVMLWQAGGDDPVPCGVANQSVVTSVACHPNRTVVAAGYGNGTVVLCQPNSQALLFIRAAGEGAVTALGFAPGGGHLGIGTEGGEIAVLALPKVLFRDSSRPE